MGYYYSYRGSQREHAIQFWTEGSAGTGVLYPWQIRLLCHIHIFSGRGNREFWAGVQCTVYVTYSNNLFTFVNKVERWVICGLVFLHKFQSRCITEYLELKYMGRWTIVIGSTFMEGATKGHNQENRWSLRNAERKKHSRTRIISILSHHTYSNKCNSYNKNRIVHIQYTFVTLYSTKKEQM